MAGNDIGKRMGACLVCATCAIPVTIPDLDMPRQVRCDHCRQEGNWTDDAFTIGPWYSTRAFFERVEKATDRKLDRLRRIIQGV